MGRWSSSALVKAIHLGEGNSDVKPNRTEEFVKPSAHSTIFVAGNKDFCRQRQFMLPRTQQDFCRTYASLQVLRLVPVVAANFFRANNYNLDMLCVGNGLEKKAESNIDGNYSSFETKKKATNQ